MSDSNSFTRSRLTSIDLLRGCAALGVVITHSFPNELTYLARQSPWFGYLGAGLGRLTLGVPLFFVISGFCIHLRWTKQYAKTGEASVDFANFWKRRLHRLYPPYLVALCICMLMVLIAYFLGRANYYPEPRLRWIGLDFVSHVFMLHGFHPLFDRGGGNPAMWTLAREEYFYILYFALLALRCRWKLTTTVLSVLALGIAFPLFMGFFLRADSYHWHTIETSAVVLWIQWVLGMVAVEAYYGVIKLPRWCRAAWFIPLWFIAGEISRAYAPILSPVFHGMTCFTLVNFCIFAGEQSWQNRRMVLWLAKVGVFSYSLYLVHYPVIMILRELFGFIAAPANVWVALIGFVVKVVACFYVARLFFRLVERRFLNPSAPVHPIDPRFSPEDKEKGKEPLSKPVEAFQTAGQQHQSASYQ